MRRNRLNRALHTLIDFLLPPHANPALPVVYGNMWRMPGDETQPAPPIDWLDDSGEVILEWPVPYAIAVDISEDDTQPYGSGRNF